METKFDMSDLGEMNYFLGMEIHPDTDVIFISQRKYAWDILKRFKIERFKLISTPLAVYRSLIGSLLYFTATRPDLMFAASLLSRFMQDLSQVHLGVTKQTLSSDQHIADIMTKALPNVKFEVIRAKLGVSKKNLKEEC
ncbi:hypothetical protein KY290_013629 [Solanum tuberosum]|uniref:Reverse transcriptase Ty1/copia-type domain-containing protein n=1 Tax=Solanum tuberosum TaxID=4113 RepID=A0ABQ7VP30_SOLTU|nr:hypothetical protein KY290_013629 [Solanum tuberosum]